MHHFQVPAESSNAVAVGSPQHVPDLALKPAGLDSFFVSSGAPLELDTNTMNSGGAQSQDWRALLCEQQSREVLTDTEVGRRHRYVPSRLREAWGLVILAL